MLSEVGSRWTHTDELLRTACMMLDNLTRITVRAHSKDPPRFPPAFAYLRPGETARSNVVRPSELARRMEGRH